MCIMEWTLKDPYAFAHRPFNGCVSLFFGWMSSLFFNNWCFWNKGCVENLIPRVKLRNRLWPLHVSSIAQEVCSIYQETIGTRSGAISAIDNKISPFISLKILNSAETAGRCVRVYPHVSVQRWQITQMYFLHFMTLTLYWTHTSHPSK